MGKDLKGKELGKGVRQRKDGRYEARAIVDGIKISVIKSNLRDCLIDFRNAKQRAANNMDYKRSNITLNEWFEEWFETYKKPKVKLVMDFDGEFHKEYY